MVRPKLSRYFKILAPEYPGWLDDYVATPRMQKQAHISVSCGTIYSDLFKSHIFYSNLDHSIATALIVWRFTRDKKQTLAALFHDIATPAFKHCIDIMNGDYLTQESTEEITSELIAASPEIRQLLKRDAIKTSEVDDYHLYPIADNDTPKLSADRLEYSLSNALFTYPMITLDQVAALYADIEVQENPSGEIELGFRTKKFARQLVSVTSKLSITYRDHRTRYSMQLVADILSKLSKSKQISISDLYEKSEAEIIEIIKRSPYAPIFETWQRARRIFTSDIAPKGVYSVHHPSKTRYIDPLFKGERVSKQCKIAAGHIKRNLSYDMEKYTFLPNVPPF